MSLEIPYLQVVVTIGVTGFCVNLPFKNFGSNTQGHCGKHVSLQCPCWQIICGKFKINNNCYLSMLSGTCNNNQADDCMLPGGQLVESCAVMADHWPAKHIEQPDCPIPVLPTNTTVPTPTQTPCRPDSMCDLLKSR